MTSSDTEAADAARVDAAVQLIGTEALDAAESLLLSVIANTPRVYANSLETTGGLSIKFWGQQEFIHYVTWHERDPRGTPHSAVWLKNAYPRAYYYLGFLCVKRKQFARAIDFLDKGRALEPTNPKFKFETAQALLSSGRMAEALALYEEVTEIGPYTSARDLAMARRGRGFALIEIGRLDKAELAFKASLEIEPQNRLALHELGYIDHLRRDGARKPPERVATTPPRMTECHACGKPFKNGVVLMVDQSPVGVCKACAARLNKKWWQFWK